MIALACNAPLEREYSAVLKSTLEGVTAAEGGGGGGGGETALPVVKTGGAGVELTPEDDAPPHAETAANTENAALAFSIELTRNRDIGDSPMISVKIKFTSKLVYDRVICVNSDR